MEIETLNAMNEVVYLNLLMAIKVIVLISFFCAIAGFAIYLAGVIWLCFEEARQPARRPFVVPASAGKLYDRRLPAEAGTTNFSG